MKKLILFGMVLYASTNPQFEGLMDHIKPLTDGPIQIVEQPDSMKVASGKAELLGVIPAIKKYEQTIMKYSRMRGLDPYLVAAVIRQEACYAGCYSRIYGRNRGDSGEYGVMQVMYYHHSANPDLLHNVDFNIRKGTAYLVKMIHIKKDIWKGVSAYNTGPNTRRINTRYVNNVVAYYNQYRENERKLRAEEKKQSNGILAREEEAGKYKQGQKGLLPL